MVVANLATSDGAIRGRDRDGNPIIGRIAGKSKARQLMEDQQARESAERAKQPSVREQRRKRGGR